VDDFLARKAALAPKAAEIAERYKDDPKKRDAETSALLENLQRPRAKWTAVVDHIERVMKLAGPRAVGLGTDYDGIDDPPEGLEDVSKLPIVTEELLRRGHSEDVVRGVLGENFLRFWERAEAAKKTVPPRDKPLPFSKP
jgi:membrane dipeptidase